ncbi:MAG: TetR/AcrR family transcriptional regulator, partial [Lachnospiraceae bacterium]
KNEEISELTKQRMADSLKKFMAEKPFEKITVREIIEDCEISRPTFYYHFEDIYQLMVWMFQREMIDLLQKSEDVLTWDEGILLVFRYVQENRNVCLCAYRSIGRDGMKRLFYDSIRDMLGRFVAMLNEKVHAGEEYVEFLTDFYTQAFVGCLLSWLQDGTKKSPEEMTELLDITVHGDILAALERSAAMEEKQRRKPGKHPAG